MQKLYSIILGTLGNGDPAWAATVQDGRAGGHQFMADLVIMHRV